MRKSIPLWLCLAVLGAPSLLARTFIFSHVLESSARANTSGVGIDTSFVITGWSGLAGTPAAAGTVEAQVYLFGSTGSEMTSGTGVAVCAPCVVTIDDTHRQRTVSVQDQFEAKGGFPSSIQLGYAVVTTIGAGADSVTVQQVISNSIPFAIAGDANNDRTVTTGDLFYLINHLFAGGPGPANSLVMNRLAIAGRDVDLAETTFIVPQVIERQGSVNVGFTSDVWFSFVNATGRAGLPGSPGFTVELHLFAPDGTYLTAASGPICAPCTYSPAAGQRVQANVENLVAVAGGWGTATVKEGFAVVRTNDATVPFGISALDANARSSPFDLILTVLPVQASGSLGALP